MSDADVWEDNGVTWETGKLACRLDDCYVGFNFIADQLSDVPKLGGQPSMRKPDRYVTIGMALWCSLCRDKGHEGAAKNEWFGPRPHPD